MGSLVEELRRREAAARAEAGRLRSRIEELAVELARAEEQVSRLVIAREEVARVLEVPVAAEPPAGPAGGPAGEPRLASPIGAVTVPPWQEGAEASVLPRSYQDLLEVAALPPRPRAPAALPRHHAGPLHTRRLTGHLIPNELHPEDKGQHDGDDDGHGADRNKDAVAGPAAAICGPLGSDLLPCVLLPDPGCLAHVGSSLLTCPDSCGT